MLHSHSERLLQCTTKLRIVWQSAKGTGKREEGRGRTGREQDGVEIEGEEEEESRKGTAEAAVFVFVSPPKRHDK